MEDLYSVLDALSHTNRNAFLFAALEQQFYVELFT